MRYYLKGEITKMVNINPETLRFYEKINLIPTPQRSKNGYRQYPENTLLRLVLIERAKVAGFTLGQIKELFSLAKNETMEITDITNAVERRIKEIDTKMEELKEQREQLINFNLEMQIRICPDIEDFLYNSEHK